MSATEQLDKLVGQLDRLVRAEQKPGDAIDAILAAAPRQSAVASLAESECMVRFRQELIDGLIRVDTIGQVLGLVQQVVTMLAAGRA